jgi:DNA-binding response OmpR family regulator
MDGPERIRLRAMANTEMRKSIVMYSDDSAVRAAMKAALGKRTSDDLPEHDIQEFATGDAFRAYMDKNSADLVILDAEATPEGGMGISRQLKDEVFQCPPILLITARADDAWLATWSRADAFVLHPIDPFVFADKAAQLLRQKSLAQ